jgi:hypothetical protein
MVRRRVKLPDPSSLRATAMVVILRSFKKKKFKRKSVVVIYDPRANADPLLPRIMLYATSRICESTLRMRSK